MLYIQRAQGYHVLKLHNAVLWKKYLQSKLVNLDTRSNKATWCCIPPWLVFPVSQPGKMIGMELSAAMVKLLPVSVHVCSTQTCLSLRGLQRSVEVFKMILPREEARAQKGGDN